MLLQSVGVMHAHLLIKRSVEAEAVDNVNKTVLRQ